MYRLYMLLGFFIAVSVLVLSFIPNNNITKNLTNLSLNENFQFVPKEQPNNEKLTFETYRVKKDDSLSEILNNMQYPPYLAIKISEMIGGKAFTQLKSGDVLKFGFNKLSVLKKIIYQKHPTITYVLTINEGALLLNKKIKLVQLHTSQAGGTIENSFYMSGKKSGINDNTIMNLADIFSWEVDFMRQLRKGDTFKVIYEQKYVGSNYIGDGDVLAAQIVTSDGKSHYAFLIKDSNGKKIGYFNEKGKNLRKNFLRNPVNYLRISSKFQKRRYHPILNRWKFHRGVDYAAPTGTPIYSTGKGRVIIRKWSSTYGRVIIVEHANKYSTLYAHMSRFGKYKKNKKVKQGSIIGYIGSSGRATGPHLHYEFRVSGKHVDPLKLKFKNLISIPKKHKKYFESYSNIMLNQLDRISVKPVIWMQNFE